MNESTKEHLTNLVERIKEHTYDLSSTLEEITDDSQWQEVSKTLDQLHSYIKNLEENIYFS